LKAAHGDRKPHLRIDVIAIATNIVDVYIYG
jgi:hypothetical protein